MQSLTEVTELKMDYPHRRQVVLVAWLGMLLLSRLPQIIAQEFLGIDLGPAVALGLYRHISLAQ